MAKDFVISDLLGSERIPGLELAAGKAGVGNRINNVNTIDNLDSYDWLCAGDFLLTTGFIYKDNPSQLTEMVERLERINCAGLGFKTKRYYDSLPPEMLKKADELGFPVLEIPLKYSLADISNSITDELRAADDTRFTQYLVIHNSFNECVLSGGGAKELIDTLYNFIRNPVVLVDSRWRILASQDPRGEIEHLDLKNAVIQQQFADGVPEAMLGKAKIVTRIFRDGEKGLTVRIAQLEDNSSVYGYVLAFETNRRFDWMDFVALESAAVPIVLERVKAKKINEVKHQLRQDFFDDLLQGRIDSVNAVSSLAEIHHMDIKKTYMCMVIRLTENHDDGDYGEEQRNRFLKLKNQILSIVDNEALRQHMDTVSIYRSNLIVTFIHVPDAKRGLHTWDILEEFPEELAAKLMSLTDAQFAIGIGTPIVDYLNLKASYFQANEAIRHMDSAENGQVCYYENFMVDQLISSVPDRKILEDFVQLSIGALRDYDAEHGTNLVKTLEVYFECNGNVSMAAKKLFLHRNSLIYRIDRIKEILNSDLKKPTELLSMQVGLRVLKVLALQ